MILSTLLLEIPCSTRRLRFSMSPFKTLLVGLSQGVWVGFCLPNSTTELLKPQQRQSNMRRSGNSYNAILIIMKRDSIFYRLFQQSPWQIVVIYPTRNLEQNNAYPYRSLLNCEQVHRVYLNELGEIQQLPLGVAFSRSRSQSCHNRND